MKGETNTGCVTVCDCSARWNCAKVATALRGETIGPLLQLLHECNAAMLSVLDAGVATIDRFAMAAQCTWPLVLTWTAAADLATVATTQQLWSASASSAAGDETAVTANRRNNALARRIDKRVYRNREVSGKFPAC
jgi:hypothetical protein